MPKFTSQSQRYGARRPSGPGATSMNVLKMIGDADPNALRQIQERRGALVEIQLRNWNAGTSPRRS